MAASPSTLPISTPPLSHLYIGTSAVPHQKVPSILAVAQLPILGYE
jgi:hypothetical protein